MGSAKGDVHSPSALPTLPRRTTVPNINNNKTMIVPTPRGGNTIRYTTESTSIVNDIALGIKHNVKINFNTKKTTFFGGLAPERLLYQSPSWTARQKQQIEQAIRGTIQKIEKASVMLEDPQVIPDIIRKNPKSLIRPKLEDPKLVMAMRQYVANVKQGLEKGTINFYIDSLYNSRNEPSFKMDMTTPGGLRRLIWSPYFLPHEPIHVNPTFFTVVRDQQAKDMTHELGRYFGGITDSEDDINNHMTAFDDFIRLCEETYNKHHK